jgi:hypothetical protein
MLAQINDIRSGPDTFAMPNIPHAAALEHLRGDLIALWADERLTASVCETAVHRQISP